MSNYSTNYVNASIDMDQNGNAGYYYFLINASGNNVNVDLVQNPNDGLAYAFHRIDTSNNTVTLTAKSGSLINGSASVQLPGNKYVEVINFATNWYAPGL